MIPILVALFVSSAVLPIIGLLRLVKQAQKTVSALNKKRAERGHFEPTIGDFNEDMKRILGDMAKEERTSVVWDLILIGLGLLAGAAASVWSLFL